MPRWSILLSCLLLLSPTVQAGDPVAELVQRQRQVAELLLQSYVFVGGGSGVVISPEGLVLTNHHVAGGQEEWRLRFADGSTYPARRIGTDPIGDICLLQITAPATKTFTHVELGRAEDIRPGMALLAIGNPFSLGDADDTPTVSLGTLGSGRIVRGWYADCVQLDAAVNPGNSGGPALDLAGALIGINGQIRTRTGLRINSGIGLAIACTQLRAFLPLLRDTPTGYVQHAGPPEGLELAQTPAGVVVTGWAEPAPADPLLQPGDLLLRIADRPVTSVPTAEGLFVAQPWTGPETTVAVDLRRGDVELRLAVRTGRTPIPGRPDPGFEVVRRQQEAADGSTERYLLIGRVGDDSAAAEAGLQVGWRILQANGQPISRRLDYLKVTSRLHIGDQLRLQLRDEVGKEHHITVPMLP